MYTWEELIRLYRLTVPNIPSNLQPRYNICLTTTIDAVVEKEGKRALEPMRCGLVPAWWNIQPVFPCELDGFWNPSQYTSWRFAMDDQNAAAAAGVMAAKFAPADPAVWFDAALAAGFSQQCERIAMRLAGKPRASSRRGRPARCSGNGVPLLVATGHAGRNAGIVGVHEGARRQRATLAVKLPPALPPTTGSRPSSRWEEQRFDLD
jgi:hypothetical protein